MWQSGFAQLASVSSAEANVASAHRASNRHANAAFYSLHFHVIEHVIAVNRDVRGGPLQPHDQSYDPVDPLPTLLLRRLPVVGGIRLQRDVACHPSQYRMTSMPHASR